ncbi:MULTISPECIES: choice-of-anchor K domain-containing protein [Methylomonas]|uniref:PEP-CTERM protein-sorting domain-containing protein n=2 Tax=Methylomonas TaxID=416 RepID=A0A126T3L6_9GAMM|nr:MULTISPECIES: choice-of-anchor K domain-containing protein [Methylomonas]AMK76652.1 hypothetical protein JT25_009145 [Methylomonas denitrificans]OAH97234.1 hypothetical protein A1342_18990 [Methylomonas methanica]TCV82858.1 putative secreted protein with PEP-CTERM sorting signal [Methylomonas methanica]
MKQTFKGLGLLQAALLIWASSTQASTVAFSGTGTAAFGDYVQPPLNTSNVFYSSGKNVFADQTDFTWGGRSIKSKLAFDGLSFDTSSPAPFELGSLRYDNATFPTNLAISSVRLDIKLSFTAIGEKTISYDIGINDTPNSGCNVNGCPDIIAINPSSNDGKLLLTTIGNTQYIFEFLGFNAEGTQNSRNFETAEGGNSTAQLYGRITTSAVPVPAAVWSFLSGAMLLGGLTLRRQRQKG